MSTSLEELGPPARKAWISLPAALGRFRRDSERRGARFWIEEVVERLAASLATGYFLVGASLAVLANPSRISLLCVLLMEALNLALVLFCSVPRRRDWHPVSIVCASYVFAYAALLDTSPGLTLVPHRLADVLAALAFLLMFWAKLSLGRSFGVLPSARTVVVSGPYRYIRHPIYTSFLVIYTCFVLTDYSPRNAAVLFTLLACQLYRITREEAILRPDPEYRDYCRRVPCRFIPGIL